MEEGAAGHSGAPRNLAEPDGTRRNTNRRTLRPQISFMFVVFALLVLSFPHCLATPKYPKFRWFRNARRCLAGDI